MVLKLKPIELTHVLMMKFICHGIQPYTRVVVVVEGQIESGHIEGIYHECLTTELDILVKKNFWVSNIQARAPTEAVIPKYVQPTVATLEETVIP